MSAKDRVGRPSAVVEQNIDHIHSVTGGFYVIPAKKDEPKFCTLAEGELERYGLGEYGLEAAVARYCDENAIPVDVEMHIVADETQPHMFPTRPIALRIDLVTMSTRPQRVLREVAAQLLALANGHMPDLESYSGDGIHIGDAKETG